ncbi:hypothetical protein ACF09Y_33605 [Streptomyces massasporeus]|uniref:hypothetical protein n=1 Tax=Streptomyces massasporeus TaxID=67324 RepID=UPI0036FB37D2
MYDYTIATPADWTAWRPEAVVDPMIYRLGEIFLAGYRGPGDGHQLWNAVSMDIGGLVTFFDLLVLHDRLPAMNYSDTFDYGLNFGEHLLSLVNSRTKVIDHVNVTYSAYTTSKTAALEILRHRTGEGSTALLPPRLQDDLTEELSALEYHWNPSLGPLENVYEGAAKTAAAFLLGTLVFSAYAQQTGAPHVMSPKRSRLFAASAMSAPRGGYEREVGLYSELNRRFQGAGEGWRDQELPWTPSFLPLLLQDIDPYRVGPLDVLEMAFDLREKKAVKEYRRARAGALADDVDAFAELTKLADAMTKELRADRTKLGTQNVLVEVLPKAFGATAAATLGGLVGGTAGRGAGHCTGHRGRGSAQEDHRQGVGVCVRPTAVRQRTQTADPSGTRRL